MIELPDGRILVCPQGGSMNIISLGDELSAKPLITRVNPPGNREVLGALKDDKGYIWVGCMDGSIFIFTPSSQSFEMLTDGNTFTGLIEKIGTQLSARTSQVFFLKPLSVQSIKLQDSTGQLKPGIISNGAGGDIILDNRFPIKMGASGSVFYDFSSRKAGAALS